MQIYSISQGWQGWLLGYKPEEIKDVDVESFQLPFYARRRRE
jgi:hypothetical protein